MTANPMNPALLCLFGGSILPGAPCVSAAAPHKPNVLFIMADDHTTQTIIPMSSN
jgi:alcohol dehydrogenase YqhD (iron-dependent ADH family)